MSELRAPADGHDRYRLLAAGSIDGRIAPDEMLALERHLTGCAACRLELGALRADHTWLAAPAKVDAPRPELRDAILAAARGPRVPRTSDAPRSFLPAFVGAGALLLVGALALNLMFAPSGPGAMPSGTPGPSADQSVAPSPVPSGPVAGTCRTIPADLSARWSFDEPSERLSGAPLLLVGDARGVPGMQSSGLELAGPTSEALVPDVTVAQLADEDFTISVWVRFLHLAGEQVIVERFADGTPSVGWTLTKLESGELRLAVGTIAGVFDLDSRNARLTPEVWHHIAARRLGGTYTLFVNGRTVGSGQLPEGDAANLALERPLLIGRRGDDRGFHLDAHLDELLIWTARGLSEMELADVRAAGTAGFCEAAAGASYEGSWVATDCAATGSKVDCTRWGDGSRLRLIIGPGEEPTARFEDDSVAGCGAGGAPGPRVAEGTGRFEGVYLWVTFTTVSCAVASEEWQNPLQLYKAFNDAGLWVDSNGDGWGTIWKPA